MVKKKKIIKSGGEHQRKVQQKQGPRRGGKKGGVKPERDIRSVWSADAQAHSSTLQCRVRGGE